LPPRPGRNAGRRKFQVLRSRDSGRNVVFGTRGVDAVSIRQPLERRRGNGRIEAAAAAAIPSAPLPSGRFDQACIGDRQGQHHAGR
jgi:hypothetical protein